MGGGARHIIWMGARGDGFLGGNQGLLGGKTEGAREGVKRLEVAWLRGWTVGEVKNMG